MSVSLQPSSPVEFDVDFAGHDYRLNDDQFRRATEAGIIKADGVELRDGLLCRKTGAADPVSRGNDPLSVDQYRAMTEQGILTTDDRVELLEGWLIAKMSKNPPHTISKRLTLAAIRAVLPPGWFVAVEDPVTALDSEPEPDLSIVRGGLRDYSDKAPGPEHINLLIEVADASLSKDRSIKKRLYARSGFATYWLINLVANRIEVYTDPTGPTAAPDYQLRQDFGPGDQIPLMIHGVEITRLNVSDLLP